MTRQNRVNPLGELVAHVSRGTLMGNRGCIHDVSGRLGRTHWARKLWVFCALEFNGRHRQVMAPGQYTELFFLDEATALAAGHRPCATCQRERYETFLSTWQRAFGTRPSPSDIDAALHKERGVVIGADRLPTMPFGRVPIGAFFIQGNNATPLLRSPTGILDWSFSGYRSSGQQRLSDAMNVTLVTPVSTARLLASGYAARLHASSRDAVPNIK